MTRPALFIASQIRRRPGTIVVATMMLAIALSLGIPKLQFKTGQETLLDPTSKIALDNARFQGQFGGEP